MPSTTINDANGATQYLKVASGAGTSGDPFIAATRLDIDPATGVVGSVRVSEQTKQSTMVHGAFTATNTGTLYQVDATSRTVVQYILVGRPSGQVGSVFLGGSSLNLVNGFEMKAGDPPLILRITNINLLYVVAANGGDGIRWLLM